MQSAANPDKDRRRILRFLSPGPATLADAASSGNVLLRHAERGAISADRLSVARMVKEGLVRLADGRVFLSPLGQALEKRSSGQQTDFQAQHRDLENIMIDMGAGPGVASVNWSESPLGQLMRRKTSDGTSFLSGAESDAGERLRRDYTLGQIMPRLGANWVASVSSGRRNGGVAELTDAALSARQRVEQAIRAVGPELAGVLIDTCCFLKGMETVEAERGWPARSAKVVLKTALAVLSRHYNPQAGRQGQSSRHKLHWGAEGYRPSIR